MFTVLTCIHRDHDLRLVLLAAIICAFACVTAFRFQARSLASPGVGAWPWIGLTGLVAGSGVWATHFIAMLAYQPALSIQYDLWGTAVSLAPAILGMGAGFGLMAWRRSLAGILAGGGLAGLSIAVMHYLGVAAVRSEMQILWNPSFVIASLVIAVAGGMVAFYVASRTSGLWSWTAPPALLVLAICGLHFTGMTAVSLVPDPSVPHVTESMSRGALAGLTGGVTSLILLAAIGLIAMEARTHRIGLKSLRIAFEGVPAGLALYDKNERLVLWNQAYAEIAASFGFEPMAGMLRSELLKAAAEGGFDEARYDAGLPRDEGASRSPRGAEEELRLKDGRWLRLELCPIADGGMVVVMTDVSALKQAAETMAEARNRAEAANRSKSEFLANMSHEIRTPLNGVVAAAALLTQAQLGAREGEMVEIIRSSADDLAEMLADILDLARIESGQVVIEKAGFHLGDLVRAVTALTRLGADEKGLALEVSIAADLEAMVEGDAVRVRQILINLLNNAVKFTDRGRIALRVARGEGGGVRFEVEDTGVGFDMANKERVFSRFQQADGSITRRFGGSGLGLTISRDLAELMGGGVDCDSRPGVGSRFWLDLPLPPAATAQPTATEAGELEGERALRILLADDHPTNRKVVELMLTGTGCDLTSVEDGDQALGAFASGGYDMVLMDMQMPVMDGLTAVRRIRQMEAERGEGRVAIIMLTANAMPQHIEASMAAGADGHLGKPITPAALYGAIDKALARRAAPVDAALAGG